MGKASPSNVNVKVRELQAELRAAGFEHVGTTGSHERWRSPDGAETVTLVVHSGDAGPKNAWTIRRAIERASTRAAELKVARDVARQLRAAKGASDEDTITALQAIAGYESAVPDPVGDEDSPRFSMLLRLGQGTPVDAIAIENTGRTKRLLGTPEIASRSLFHLVQDKEWRTGEWPSVLTQLQVKKRPIGALVRCWRDRPDANGPGYIDVYWVDFTETIPVPNPTETGVAITLIYSGLFVSRPEDVEYTDPDFRLTFDREGGSWASGVPYRWKWRATARNGEVLWEGWATEPEAHEAADELWLSLAEESFNEPTEPIEPVDEPVDEPKKGEPMAAKTTKEATVQVSRIADDVIVPFEDRIMGLMRSLDTPAVRAVTGRAVTFDRVLEIVLERGISAVESDLKGNG